MLHLRKIKSFFILVFAIAFTVVSCSTDDEVIDQQEPQSQISNELRQRIEDNLNQSQNGTANEDFQEKINWYQSLSTTQSYCGIDFALLAYEVFDTENNSLNEINIVPWFALSGQSFEDLANELNQMLAPDFGEDIQLIFVAAIMVRTLDEDTFEFAEITNYGTFVDFFDDCESPDVVFEMAENDQEIEWNIPMSDIDEVDFPEDESTCVFALSFPVDVLVADVANPDQTYQITINEEQFIAYLMGEVSGVQLIDFTYPVELVTQDGTTTSVNNAAELSQALNEGCN